MRQIILNLSEQKARDWEYFLRKRFNTDKRTKLKSLIQFAVISEIHAEAKKMTETVIAK